MDPRRRHAVSVCGPDRSRSIVFAHGFGCDQSMWEPVASKFPDYRTVLFDFVGFGNSDPDAYNRARYSTLAGHADDVLDLLCHLELRDVVFVGHSVASMIGVLAANRAPELFEQLVLVGPSPRYIDDAGNPDRPEFGTRLTQTFCRSQPDAARQLARVTFLGDNRADLRQVTVPTVVLQCADDVIAPTAVGRYVAGTIPDARFVQLKARGHCPNLTAPDETARVLREHLE